MAIEYKILVIYVGVAGIRGEDIPDFVSQISQRITPKTFEGEIILVPTQSPDTRIECINPKYITEPELIQEHTELMKKLKYELQHQLNQLKQDENE